jgi:hypothetical protein
MHTDDDVKVARSALGALKILRKDQRQSLALVAIIDAIQPPVTLAHSIDDATLIARNSAWLAVCSLRVALSQYPPADDVGSLWDAAIAEMERWLLTMEKW